MRREHIDSGGVRRHYMICMLNMICMLLYGCIKICEVSYNTISYHNIGTIVNLQPRYQRLVVKKWVLLKTFSIFNVQCCSVDVRERLLWTASSCSVRLVPHYNCCTEGELLSIIINIYHYSIDIKLPWYMVWIGYSV